MSLTQDARKVWEAIDAALFPNHPYGKQTTLGTQEHLKNPSITNVKNYYATYYVPNNIRICVSGDFDPEEMVAAIEKYFGDWQPNPDIPKLEFEAEKPIEEPIVKEVVGLEAENMAIAWRLPGASDIKTTAVAQIAGRVMSNGYAGLIDLDVIQQQKVLSLYASHGVQPDYCQFTVMGRPKEGQSLEEVRDIALAEFAKLRAGEFDDALIPAIINNFKLEQMYALENNGSRALEYIDAFIFGIDWSVWCKKLEVMEGVTKADVVEFANKYLTDNSCAIVYKRKGEDTSVQKISAPAITPIVTNRDSQSAFLAEIQNTQVKPIEPVFVDFNKDMSQFELAQGVNVLYKQNTINDIAQVDITVNTGVEQNPGLGVACDYLSYLGTPDMTAEQLASKMYSLACSFSIRSGANSTTLSLVGLSENIEQALTLVENLLQNAVADEKILANVKADEFKSRANAKLSQRSCYSALTRYVSYGSEFIGKTTLSNEKVAALTSEELLGQVKEVFANGHEILYYGPMKEADLKAALGRCHKVTEGAQQLPEKFTAKVATPQASVVMAQYDAKQIYYNQYSNRQETLSTDDAACLALYNEYFGGGMNGIVFQEMREARGLAYSASARLSSPSFADDSYTFSAFIATQNDKMQIAVEAFDEIINNMPQSEAAFSIAKDALLGRLRTQRTNGISVLNRYCYCRRMGLAEPLDRMIFEKVQNMQLSDVVAAQEKWVKGRTYTYAILGDIKDLDTKFLSTLGPVKRVTLEEIFGY